MLRHMNTRASLKYLTLWSLLSRDAWIDGQVELSCCLADTAYLGDKCHIEVGFPKPLGEQFDVTDGTCFYL